MPKPYAGFYAVAIGRRPGVYTVWEKARQQVEGFCNARHRKFRTHAEAEEFVAANKCADQSSIRSGWIPQLSLVKPVISTQPRPNSCGLLHMCRECSSSTHHMDEGLIACPCCSYFRPHSRACKFGKPIGTMGANAHSPPFEQTPRKDMFTAKKKRFDAEEEAQLKVSNSNLRLQEANPSADPHPKIGKRVFPHNPAWRRAGELAGRHQTNNRAEYQRQWTTKTESKLRTKKRRMEDPPQR